MQQGEEGYRLNLFHGRPRVCHAAALSNTVTTDVQVYVQQDTAHSGDQPDCVYNPMHYPLDQLLLMNHLAPRGGVIVHSASAVVDDRALVFPGVSGAGKSTLARLFMAAGLEETLLSDDRTIVRTPSQPDGYEGFIAWGTPWSGDAKIARNASAPLVALLFLVQSAANRIEPLAPGAAMRRLMPVVSCPWYDPERGNQVLDTCARVAETIPCFNLHFRRDEEVVPLITGLSWLQWRA